MYTNSFTKYYEFLKLVSYRLNNYMEKKLIEWYSKLIIYYAKSTSITKKIWWFNKSLMLFSYQLCYFNIENWLSVYYDCRFAESVKFSAVFFSV